MLQMIGYEGCGATTDPKIVVGIPYALDDWIVVGGPATQDDPAASVVRRLERHVCSPACLVVLAQRLAELPDAIQPAAEVEA